VEEEVAEGQLRFQRTVATADNINALLKQHSLCGEIDLLVIDVDGNDYYVWDAISVVNPRVVCIEYNSKFPPPVEWIMPRDQGQFWPGSDWFGASLAAYEKLGEAKGYALVGCNLTGVNAFFVRQELASGKFAEPFTAENHYHPPRYYLAPGFYSGHPPRDFRSNKDQIGAPHPVVSSGREIASSGR
jgi:hypothetical protein